MRGEGYYDVHSEYQRRVVEGGHELVRSLVAGLELEAARQAFVIADYGAGTGATSVAASRVAISALRERAPDLPVMVVHNDVVTSDFTQLFRSISSSDGYLQIPGGPIFPVAAAGSFFTRVLPDSSVDLGMCSNASHWYRRQPALEVPEGLFFSEASGEARAALAAQAADDWLRFLSARSAELGPGANLLVQGIATTGDRDELVSARSLLLQMSDVCEGLADDGLLDRAALRRYVFPVYCRTREELTRPVVAGGPLELTLTLSSATIEEVPNPYWELLERDDDPAAYAEAYTGFVRAFAESTLLEHLFAPAAVGAPPESVCDQFFRRFEAASASDPDRGRYRAWILRAVFARTDQPTP